MHLSVCLLARLLKNNPRSPCKVILVLLLPTKEEVNAFVCLSVSKTTQKRVHGFG